LLASLSNAALVDKDSTVEVERVSDSSQDVSTPPSEADLDKAAQDYANTLKDKEPEALTISAFSQLTQRLSSTMFGMAAQNVDSANAPRTNPLYYLAFLDQWDQMLEEAVKVIDASSESSVVAYRESCDAVAEWDSTIRVSRITEYSQMALFCHNVAFPSTAASVTDDETNNGEVSVMAKDPFWFDTFLSELNHLPSFDAVAKRIDDTSGWKLFGQVSHFYMMGLNVANTFKLAIQNRDLSRYPNLDKQVQAYMNDAKALRNPIITVAIKSYVTKVMRASWLSVGLAFMVEGAELDQDKGAAIYGVLEKSATEGSLDKQLFEAFVKFFQES
jgi:hypothetical protein